MKIFDPHFQITNPNSLISGTDLPSTRAKKPFSKINIDLIKDNFTASDQNKIFYKNAYEWHDEQKTTTKSKTTRTANRGNEENKR